MTDYVKELDIKFKEIEEEYEKKQAEWERKKEEIEEKNRQESKERKNCKKKLSYKIPMLILKILVFFFIIGLSMTLGIYYFIIALIISWIVGLMFVKIF